ncbi:MAG: phosphoribosyltransferase family protein [Ginsengibacter sp.]
MNLLIKHFKALTHLLYPHICIGCGSDILSTQNVICINCFNELPHTGFARHASNPMEKIFWGRIPVTAAMSELWFSKASLTQNLIHEFKYKGNKEVGKFLGRMMGKSLKESNRFNDIDLLIPLPLFEKKEKKRGYNQSLILCEGIKEIMDVPLMIGNVQRKIATSTQTRKGRKERWENVSDSFNISNPEDLAGKRILLVDDVITTGATLEACGAELLKIKSTQLYIASLALATH